MSSADPAINAYPSWAPRFWHGMPSKIWFRHLARNRFQYDWNRFHIVLGVSCFMPGSDLLCLAQHLLFGKKIAATPLVAPPLFVLGHWRSGTTLLHELLTLDPKFASPTTFECFAPSHFLLTEDLVTRFGGWLIPNKRPMDNMKAGWALPQEDEFALMNLGAPTPYAHIMFPQHDFVDENTLCSEGFSPEQLREWKRLLDWFLRALTYRTQKPLILKSPPHTGRIQILREMYPDAKFIHIARDPRKLYPSTMKLWKSLEAVQGLQRPTDHDRLSEFVLRSLQSMYQSFEKGRRDMSESQIIDVRYEELVANPVEVVERIYRQLDIGDFQSVRPALMARSDSEKEYQTNRFGLDPEVEQLVMTRWRDYAERYGYGT
ncbi:Sulfotransferase domain protein [Pirellula sp. SH-Sr6A]|nr:Sulfotransferase domain protein [Pirellula sp. SH-Sr6A]